MCINAEYEYCVCARQRPGGVAWDAVPLTVRGLNKAAGNPPLLQCNTGRAAKIILKPSSYSQKETGKTIV